MDYDIISVLFNLANDNFTLNENREYSSRMKKFNKAEEAITESLSPDTEEALEDLLNQRSQLDGIEQEYFFAEGFCMALELMALALVRKK